MNQIADFTGETCQAQGSSNNLTGDVARPPHELIRRAEEYRQVLEAQGRSRGHVRAVYRAVSDVLEHCRGDLTRSAVERAIGRVLARGLSLRTANYYLTSVRSFCRWCADEDNRYLPHDPTRSIKKFRESKDPRKVRRAMTYEETAALLAAAERHAGVFYQLTGRDWAERWHAFLATCLRESTLNQVTVGQFSPGALRVYGWQEQKFGVDREIPLPPDSCDRITAYLAGRPSEALAFPMPDRHKVLRVFQIHALAAGIKLYDVVLPPPGTRQKKRYLNVVDVHSLRTTRGTQLALAGVPAKVAQAILGHSDASTTQKYYQRVTQADASQWVRRMPPLNPPAEPG